MDYKIVPIGGRSRVSIPVLDVYQGEKSKTDNPPTPVWIVSADELFQSKIQGFERYIPLQGLSMYTSNDASLSFGSTQNLAASASLQHSEVIVAIENGGYGPPLETHMNTNKLINNASIVRLTSINGKLTRVQDIKLSKCLIKKIQQEFDRLFIWLTISSRTNTFFMFDSDGSPRGSVVSEANYVQGSLNT